MGDFPYLDWLTRVYHQKAKKSLVERRSQTDAFDVTYATGTAADERANGWWLDCVKAHGLANACVARDRTEERRERVYKIEKLWYNESHPCTEFDKHRELTNDHQTLLQDFRERANRDFALLKEELEYLDIDNMFGDTNLERAQRLAQRVFSVSNQCSEELARLSRCIIESSVSLLSDIDLVTQCPFAVIGLGSISRGEATPYSDLEYAFLVQDHRDDDYFMQLAMDNYFRIGNFGETPLWSYWIEELKDEEDAKTFADEVEVVGFRFDGITKNSGNIPTGNGLKNGKCLILTPSELMARYREELAADGDLVGDLTHLLSSSTLIYSNAEGQHLYDSFLNERLRYEKEEALFDGHARRKRLGALKKDVTKYKFLPDVNFAPSLRNTDIVVKPDIFRYITLLATNVKIFLALDTSCPWDTYSKLQEMGILSMENYRYICIVLAFSIYIRTGAYLSQNTQSDRLSIYTCSTDKLVRDRYYVPRKVFVTLGCLLVPIKNTIRKYISDLQVEDSDVLEMKMKAVLGELQISKNDYMLKAEILFFVGLEYPGMMEIYNGAGRDNVIESCDKFIANICRHYNCLETHSSIKHYVNVCCCLLFSTNEFRPILSYVRWLELSETSGNDIAKWKTTIAQCHNHLRDYKSAITILDDVFTLLENELALGTDEPFYTFLELALERLDSSEEISEQCMLLYEVAAHASGIQAISYLGLKLFQEAEKCSSKCVGLYNLLQMRRMKISPHSLSHLNNGAALCIEVGEYERALELFTLSLTHLKKIHGENTNHANVASVYNNIGRVCSILSRDESALSNYTKSLEMEIALYGDDFNHPDIATSYQNIGNLYSTGFGDYLTSLTYHTKCLSMLKALYDSDHPDIADTYGNFGNVYALMGQYVDSLKYHKEALKMKVKVYGDKVDHPSIASTCNNIGKVQSSLERHSDALECFLTAVRMYKARLGDECRADIAAIYSNIGVTYMYLSDLPQSLVYQLKALEMRKRLYSCRHPELATSYLNIGVLYLNMEKHEKALDYCQQSLVMFKAIYIQSPCHPQMCSAHLSVAISYTRLAKYSEALEHCFKSLDINEARHADSAHCDTAKNYEMIADVFERAGVLTEAVAYCAKAIAMLNEIYSRYVHHPSLLRMYINMGDILAKLNRHIDVLRYFTMAMEGSGTSDEDSGHFDVAALHTKLGVTYSCLDNYPKAFEHLNAALERKKRVHSNEPNHQDIIDGYLCLGRLHYRCKEFPQAFHCYEQALNRAAKDKETA